jgi:crotonobetaine/carnitine-CoA ligase
VDVLRELARDDDLIATGLRRTAELHGDRPFLIRGADGARLAYAEADTLVRRVANALGLLGVAAGDPVAVFTSDSFVSAVTMFATWRAGALYAPVNPELEGAALRHQLGDARPVIVVCDAERLGALEAVRDVLDARCIVVTDQETSTGWARATLAWDDLVSSADDREPAIERSPHAPANVFYTSGTTGMPKGVVQPYRWMNQYTFILRRMLTADDVVHCDLPLHHIGGALASVGRAAWAGASVALWNKFSARDFWRRVDEVGASVAILLDVMIPWLMRQPPSERDRTNTLNKVIMQPLPLYHHEVAQRFGIDWVLVGFGQTESGSVCAGLIDELPDGAGAPTRQRKGLDRETMRTLFDDCGFPVVPGAQPLAKGWMGRPTPYLEVDVVDGDDERCGRSDVGELVVRSRMPSLLLHEYRNRPDATANAMRNQWYHTGDLVRVGDDDNFYFVDRKGDRIRRRGENVSSLQVEDLLNQRPGVAMTAVVAIPARDGFEHDIAAFLVPADGHSLDIDDVREWIRAEVPKFMAPDHIRIVADLPRTPTNKVQKHRLRDLIVAELEGGGDHEGSSGASSSGR